MSKYYTISNGNQTLTMTIFEFANEFNIETDEDVSAWSINDIIEYVNDNGMESFELMEDM